MPAILTQKGGIGANNMEAFSPEETQVLMVSAPSTNNQGEFTLLSNPGLAVCLVRGHNCFTICSNP